MGFESVVRTMIENNARLNKKNSIPLKLPEVSTDNSMSVVDMKAALKLKELKLRKKKHSSIGGIIHEPKRGNLFSQLSFLGFVISTIYLLVHIYGG